jgi:hypothetical protein
MADRKILEAFLSNPNENLGGTTIEFIWNRDGCALEAQWPCSFEGLLPKPTAAESATLNRSFNMPYRRN